MSKLAFTVICALTIVTVCAAQVHATDVSAKKIQIKDNAKVAKRQIQVQAKDAAILLADADDPSANRASVHVYSATDDQCFILPAGADWKTNGKKWKYKSKTTKNQAQVKDGALKVKIKSGIGYSLNEPSQGTVNVLVQFGSGVRYCLKCTGNKKDDNKKFLGKKCVAAVCDAEPSLCDPLVTTTTTTTTSTTVSTTTTTCPAAVTVIQGALTPTLGRFNYNLTLGLPGANAACSSNFACAHACTYAELQAAEAAGEFVGLTDIASNSVTSFWAIDGSQPPLQQCNDDALGGSGLNWEYATAHTASRGQRVTLDNGTGALGSLQSSVQCNIAGSNWVGCCR